MTTRVTNWRRPFAALAAIAVLVLAGCNTPPAYQVSEPTAGRIGRVESIQTQTVQNVPNSWARSVVR